MLGSDSLRDIELESDINTEIGAVKLSYLDAINNLRKTRIVSPSFLSSDTLAAAIDLCSSSASSSGSGKGKGNHLEVDADLEIQLTKEEEEEEGEKFIQCKIYYTIGWLAAERAMDGPSLIHTDESIQRHLGLSLNQLSFALLRAIQRLSMPVSEAVQIVQQKIEYFTKRLPDSSMSTPWDSGDGSDSDNGGAMTQITAAAVTYRETRLLSSLANSRSKKGRDELMAFWSSTLTVHPSLLNYSTALFELLDAHMGAENGTGVLLWGREAVKGGAMLPFMRVKDLLVRYSDTLSLHNLPALLPLLAKLSASHVEEEMEARSEDRVADTKPQLLESYMRSSMSGLSLPLSMSVLRDLCVKLLGQGRLNDASALLKCVHPLQWPYDELLFSLATVVESDMGAVRNRQGSVGRKRECMDVMRRREELSATLPAIKSSTARALLAMHVDAESAPEKEKTEEVESQQLFRLMVARAVKSVGTGTVAGSDAIKKKGQVSSIGSENHNGRSLKSSSTTNAISQDDVRSGLLALLTLYNLTDQAVDKVSEMEFPIQVSKKEPSLPTLQSIIEEETATTSAPVLRWIDPESPENLSKFLLDVESLGSAWRREEQTTLKGSKEGSSQITIERSGEVEPISGNLGLRVSGSKKSWKRGSSFGLSFSKTGSSTARVNGHLPSLKSEPSTIVDRSSVGKMVEREEESIDVLICRELAESLLETVTAQIAAHRDEKIESDTRRDLQLELMQLNTSSGDKVSERRIKGSRRRAREVDRVGESSISGATQELFSLENQPQADRLFSHFKHSEDLCYRLLQLFSLRADTASAALVIEQMESQKILFREADREDVTWQVDLAADVITAGIML